MILFDEFHKEDWLKSQIKIIKMDDSIFLMLLHSSINFLQLFDKCESPVERLLLLALSQRLHLTADDPTDTDIKEWSDSFEMAQGTGKWPEGCCGLNIRPQFTLRCRNGARYRLDFQVTYLNNLSDNYEEYDTHFLAVEVDGHEFHEKTKQQARRDKQRDRDIARAGYTILRFTGSEVYADPFKVADEIVDTFSTL